MAHFGRLALTFLSAVVQTQSPAPSMGKAQPIASDQRAATEEMNRLPPLMRVFRFPPFRLPVFRFVSRELGGLAERNRSSRRGQVNRLADQFATS